MSCSWPSPTPAEQEDRATYQKLEADGRAIAAREQPRAVYGSGHHRTLPHAEPHLQPQCLLLEKLPAELRLRIWADVFYHLLGPRVRLERWRPVFGGEDMFSEDRSALDTDCFPYRVAMVGSHLVEHPLGLLLSCRQLYADAIPPLYSTPEFVFTNMDDLLSFQLTLSPNHLNQIRHLLIVLDGVDRLHFDLFHPRNTTTRATYKSDDDDNKNDDDDDATILHRWRSILHHLKQSMHTLLSLQIWLMRYRYDTDVPGRPPTRPWEDRSKSLQLMYPDASSPWRQEHQMTMSILERRHRVFFDLLRNIDIDSGTDGDDDDDDEGTVDRKRKRKRKKKRGNVLVDLTWWPEDVLGALDDRNGNGNGNTLEAKREGEGREDDDDDSGGGGGGRSFTPTFRSTFRFRTTEEMGRDIAALPQPRFTDLYD